MRKVKGPVSIHVEEAGPLLGILRIDSSAPGSRNLSRRIRVVAGRPGVEIINSVDKEKNLDPEGVYFSFPLNIPDGMVHMDIPWGVMKPEKDQLPGANRNYYPIQRWMDISNEDYGMTWVTKDAPMVKFSPMELVGKGRGDSEHMAEFEAEGVRPWWRKFINPGQSFYSWVMNNHWEVNYKAFQEGAAGFTYYLVPHRGSYRGDVAEKIAREFCQPLIAHEADPEESVKGLPFELSGEELIVTSLSVSEDGSAYQLRLYNPLESSGRTRIISRTGQSIHIRKAGPEKCFSRVEKNQVELPGFGVLSLEISLTGEY
jgi:alpha-mannosidase